MNERTYPPDALPAYSVPHGAWIAAFQTASSEHDDQLHLLHRGHGSTPREARRAGCKVVFDGVLYNETELRTTYKSQSPQQLSDAELLLAVYLDHGEDALQHIKGIFSLIIWDSGRDVLLCARDRLGIYPLFYTDTARTLLLSTSSEALAKHPLVLAKVDRVVVADYLLHRWPALDETFFEGVKRVPPGYVMRIQRGYKRIERYWTLPVPNMASTRVTGDEVEAFDALMEQAVNRCLQFGRAGVFLSGGIDSVTVAAFAADSSRRRNIEDPWALSLAFSDPECNEEPVQRGVAAGLGLPQLVVPVEEASGSTGLLSAALGLSSRMSSPLQHFWLPAYVHLGQAARQRGCQVIMTGGGGDDWLTVGPIYAAELLRRGNAAGLLQLLASYRHSFTAPLPKMLRYVLWDNGVRPLAHAASVKGLRKFAPQALGIYQYRNRERARESTPPWIAPDPVLRRELDRRLERRIERDQQRKEPVELYWDSTKSTLEQSLLAFSMEEGFESWQLMGLPELLPFWDPDLIELLYRTPPERLNKGGKSKGIVRATLAKRFPDLGFERQKKVMAMNFFSSIMLHEGQPTWRNNGGVPVLAGLDIVDGHRLNTFVENVFSSQQMQGSYSIWDPLNLEAWVTPRV